MCHVGSTETLFLPERNWTFHSSLQIRDSEYHSEMNADSFKE